MKRWQAVTMPVWPDVENDTEYGRIPNWLWLQNELERFRRKNPKKQYKIRRVDKGQVCLMERGR